MNKGEMVAAIADKAELSQAAAERALNAMLDTVKESLTGGDTVALMGFGTFEVRERSARKGRNPSTGAEIDIPASKAPAFKAGKALKDAVNG